MCKFNVESRKCRHIVFIYKNVYYTAYEVITKFKVITFDDVLRTRYYKEVTSQRTFIVGNPVPATCFGCTKQPQSGYVYQLNSCNHTCNYKICGR